MYYVVTCRRFRPGTGNSRLGRIIHPRTFVYSSNLSSLLFISVSYSRITAPFTMPDVSKHEAVLQDVKNGNIRTLGVSIGPVTITPGQKIAKAGENTKLTHAGYIYI